MLMRVVPVMVTMMMVLTRLVTSGNRLDFRGGFVLVRVVVVVVVLLLCAVGQLVKTVDKVVP